MRGASIAAQALLKAAGVTEAALQEVKNAGAWRDLMGHIQHAESLGMDMRAEAAPTISALLGRDGPKTSKYVTWSIGQPPPSESRRSAATSRAYVGPPHGRDIDVS